MLRQSLLCCPAAAAACLLPAKPRLGRSRIGFSSSCGSSRSFNLNQACSSPGLRKLSEVFITPSLEFSQQGTRTAAPISSLPAGDARQQPRLSARFQVAAEAVSGSILPRAAASPHLTPHSRAAGPFLLILPRQKEARRPSSALLQTREWRCEAPSQAPHLHRRRLAAPATGSPTASAMTGSAATAAGAEARAGASAEVVLVRLQGEEEEAGHSSAGPAAGAGQPAAAAAAPAGRSTAPAPAAAGPGPWVLAEDAPAGRADGPRVAVAAGDGVPRAALLAAVASAPFQAWLQQLHSPEGLLGAAGGCGGAPCELRGVTVQSVDFFGSRVGFVKFVAHIIDSESKAKLPGIVFARGNAVGILLLLRTAGSPKAEGGPAVAAGDYALLTEQARVPVARSILELPAGMMDEDAGDFVGTAAREVYEETGIRLQASHLTCLTDFLDPSTGRQMLPSPGGCDEGIRLFLYRALVPPELIGQLQGRATGLREHGELIRVHAVPYSTLWRMSADSKVLTAISLYEHALKEGLLKDEFLGEPH